MLADGSINECRNSAAFISQVSFESHSDLEAWAAVNMRWTTIKLLKSIYFLAGLKNADKLILMHTIFKIDQKYHWD